jgi:hypothetical protein
MIAGYRQQLKRGTGAPAAGVIRVMNLAEHCRRSQHGAGCKPACLRRAVPSRHLAGALGVAGQPPAGKMVADQKKYSTACGSPVD